jgi:citrate synthase
MAGLSALTSPQFGGRLAQVSAFVAETRPGAAARQRLAQGLELPGFGDAAFPNGDPRARALIEAAGLTQDLQDIVRVGEGLTGAPVNFDMALALVARRLDLPKDGPFTVSALGRTCGWLAHAMEQALSGAPVRARLRYVGPEPELA